MGLHENEWRRVYEAHLHSPRWVEFRKRIIWKRGAFCEICKSVDRIHLHHLTYERFGDELESDVQILCYACHDRVHDGRVAAMDAEKKLVVVRRERSKRRYRKNPVKPVARAESGAVVEKRIQRKVSASVARHAYAAAKPNLKAHARWKASQSHPVTLKPIIDLTGD